MLGENYPRTLQTVMNVATFYMTVMNDFGKAEEYYEGAFKGFEAQFGKEDQRTKTCARNIAGFFAKGGDKQKLRKILDDYPHLLIDQPALNNYL